MNRERPHINLDQVTPSLEFVSIENYLYVLYHRHGLPPPEYKEGDEVNLISDSYDTAVTNQRLRGARRALRDRALVLTQEYVIPTIVNKEHLERLKYGHELGLTALTYLQIDEPGILRPARTEFKGFFLRQWPEVSAGAEGVTRFLNFPHNDFLNYDEQANKVYQAGELIKQIDTDEKAHIEDLLNGLSSDS